MLENNRYPPVLQSYLRYLNMVEGLSEATQKARCIDVQSFLRFLCLQQRGGCPPSESADLDPLIQQISVTDLASVTEDDIYAYMNYLSDVKKLQEQTIYRRKVSGLRMFYEYLIRHQDDFGVHIHENPVPKVHRKDAVSKTPCRVLSRGEISRVLKAVQGEAAVRDVAIILLISTAGLTTSEVARIRYQDYRDDTLVVAGRVIHLTQACQKAIDQYICQFRDPISDFLKDNTLFVSRNYCRRLTSRGIQRALQKHFDHAGVEATPRDLRHTAVMVLLSSARNECERTYIAGCLGYSSKQSLRDFPLPKFRSDNSAMPRLLESTWLNDLDLGG